MFHALGIWARGFRLGLAGPGRLRRTAFTTAVFLAWSLVRTAVAIGRGLDHVFFPGFRRTEVRAPVYVVGAPRSGTTFLHELLALDRDRFTSLPLYETLLPSIVLCRALEALAAVDRAMSRPLGRLIAAFERRAFGGWEDIHATTFARHEEPEGLWVLRMATPAAYLLFPYFDALPEPASLDLHASERARRAAVAFYVGSLKRHLHRRRDGRDRTLLVKSVLFFSRYEAVGAAIPDIRFVYLWRDPRAAIPSALSMFTKPWSVHSPRAAGPTPETRRLAELLMDGVRRYGELRASTPPGRWLDVRFTDLVERPVEVVASIYRHLGLELEDRHAERVRGRAEEAGSRGRLHAYTLEEFGLCEADVEAAFPKAAGDAGRREPRGP